MLNVGEIPQLSGDKWSPTRDPVDMDKDRRDEGELSTLGVCRNQVGNINKK
jgi:hypothetical protein